MFRGFPLCCLNFAFICNSMRIIALFIEIVHRGVPLFRVASIKVQILLKLCMDMYTQIEIEH